MTLGVFFTLQRCFCAGGLVDTESVLVSVDDDWVGSSFGVDSSAFFL